MMNEWCEEVIKRHAELSGIIVESISAGELVLSIVPRAVETPTKYRLAIGLNPGTTAVSALEVFFYPTSRLQPHLLFLYVS